MWVKFLVFSGIGGICGLVGNLLGRRYVRQRTWNIKQQQKRIGLIALLCYGFLIVAIGLGLCFFHTTIHPVSELVESSGIEKLIFEMAWFVIMFIIAFVVPLTAGFVVMNAERITGELKRDIEQLKESLEEVKDAIKQLRK